MAKSPKKPDYNGSIVAQRNGKDIWTRVGVAFNNESEAAPITILLNPGVTLTGDIKLVLSVPKVQQDEAEAA